MLEVSECPTTSGSSFSQLVALIVMILPFQRTCPSPTHGSFCRVSPRVGTAVTPRPARVECIRVSHSICPPTVQVIGLECVAM
jgi:hypothetical protein